MAAEVVAAQLAEKFNFEELFKGGGIFGGGGGDVLEPIAITAQRLPEVGGAATATALTTAGTTSAAALHHRRHHQRSRAHHSRHRPGGVHHDRGCGCCRLNCCRRHGGRRGFGLGRLEECERRRSGLAL